MTAAPVHLGGERVMLDPAGVALVARPRVLVVSDLHLEKGSHFARAGRFVPPYDTRETLERLAGLVKLYGPKRIVLLGDSFHDPEGPARMQAADRDLLGQIMEGREIVWVLGNHDPVPPKGLAGEVVPEWREGMLVFRHEGGGPGAEVSGHFHPKASLPTRAGPVTRPCFLFDGRRLLMPAFGAYTGGLDVRNPAIAKLFPRGGRAFLLGKDRLYSGATGPLRGRPGSEREMAQPELTMMGGGAVAKTRGLPTSDE